MYSSYKLWSSKKAQASWVRGLNNFLCADQVLPYRACACAAETISVLFLWILECIAKAAALQGSPSSTFPFSSISDKLETQIWLKWTPKGFTQKVFLFSGSLAVMCPARPSLKPNLENSLNEAA